MTEHEKLAHELCQAMRGLGITTTHEDMGKELNKLGKAELNFEIFQARAKGTAIYPDAGTGSVAELMYLTLGLAGEVAELCVQSCVDFENDDAIKKELGDVCWYFARMADALDWQLTDEVLADIEHQPSGQRIQAHAGNLCNLVKKLYRDGDSEQKRAEIVAELAYFPPMIVDWCNLYHFELSDVLRKNQEKLSRRQAGQTLGGSGDER